MEQLDPQVVNLAKAIRQVESGGDFSARSKDGSYGAYQFIKPTWDATARKYGVNADWKQATPQQQNEVAYKQLKEWKDQGYNVGQIASMWNAGAGRPNAYVEGLKGTNKDGVNYDVSKYAEKVAKNYQQFKTQSSGIVPPPSEDMRQAKITSERMQLAKEGEPVSIDPEKTKPSIGGQILRGLIKPLARAGATVIDPLEKAISGKKTPTYNPYVGDIPGLGMKPDQTPIQRVKDVVGGTLELGSLAVGGGGVGTVAKATTAGLIRRGLYQGGKAGMQSGALSSTGQVLQDDVDAGTAAKRIIASTALGTIGGGFLGGTAPAVSSGIKFILPKTIKENVARVLKNTGSKKLGQVSTSKDLDKAVVGFDTIRENAPKIIVKDINDMEKAFVPGEATFFELPQALHQTKQSIYDQYTKIANDAGDAGAVFNPEDFMALENLLKKYEGAGYTPAYTTKANQFVQAIRRFGKEEDDGSIQYGQALPKDIQSLIENINLDVNPLSDKAGAQVANDLSSTIRRILDDKIEKSGNPAYQQLRNKYASLKSIEKDIIARYKESLRKANADPNLIDGLSSLDALMGIVNMNPAQIVRGGIIQALKRGFGYLKDPEVRLQKVFKALEERAYNSKSMPIIAPKANNTNSTANSDISNIVPKVENLSRLPAKPKKLK